MFTNPSYSNTEGVAQATHKTDDAGLIIRKADGKRTTPLTGRNTFEFAANWQKNHEGFDVDGFGVAGAQPLPSPGRT